MKASDLFREIGLISDNYIEEAKEIKKDKRVKYYFPKSIVAVAGLCICIGGYYFVKSANQYNTNSMDSTAYNITNFTTAEVSDQEMASDFVVEKGISLEDAKTEESLGYEPVALVVLEFNSSGMTLECKNLTNQEIITGEWYCIQKYENNVWNPLTYAIEGDISWQEVATMFTEEKSLKVYIDWKCVYGALDNGKYRNEKECFVEDNTYLQYAVFDI